jgi:hypothetical protein
MPGCALLLLAGLLRRSRDLVQAGFAALVLTALITVPVFRTGGPAARVVRELPGVVRAQIGEHDEAADFGLWSAELLGALGLVGLWLARRPSGAPGGFTVVVLLAAVWSSTVFGRVAHLGGLIRHPEISSTEVSPPSASVPAAPPTR